MSEIHHGGENDRHNGGEVNVGGAYRAQGLSIGHIGGEDQHYYNPRMGSNVYNQRSGYGGGMEMSGYNNYNH